ncbi:MAG: VOC family protein [Solirubrobacteraceae bacterium]
MTSSAPTDARATIDPLTSMGTVHLTVSDVERSRTFYERVLGLRSSEQDGGEVALAREDDRTLVQLHGNSSAPALDRRATGLFHLAVLLPTRLDLAFALARLSASRWPLDGASDHLVSEALYLSDPDGNGIEIYRDRPREEWRVRDGQLEMATLPLDLRDVAGELAAATEAQPHVPAGTRIGHVHLQVSELAETERFYAGVLGFEVMVRGYPGALFVAAGGYHHHLGLNTWNSAGSGPPVPGAIGLRQYEIQVPDLAALDSVLARVEEQGIPIVAAEEMGPDGRSLRDPSGNAVVLRTA